MRYRQHGNPRRSREGACGLCGRVGKLSRTHVPPRSAGNQGKTRFAAERLDDAGHSTTVFDRPRDGGMWGYWLCEPCNHRARSYDEEFTRWALSTVEQVEEANHEPGTSIYLRCAAADSGAFVRSLWAWAFAVDQQLRPEHPQLAEAVRSGAPIAAPAEDRMLLGVTSDRRIYVVMQRGGRMVKTHLRTNNWHQTSTGILVPGPEELAMPRIVISSPPFVALLASIDDDTGLEYFDTAPWLEEPPGTTREVHARLPLTSSVNHDASPRLISYQDLAATPIPSTSVSSRGQ